MNESTWFATIAPYLSNPLILIGFGLLLVFRLFSAVLKSSKLPTTSQRVAGIAILRLVRYGFYLALLLMLLGFGLVYFEKRNNTAQHTSVHGSFVSGFEHG